MRPALTLLGGLMILSGLLWAAQGSGILPWPAQSPMIAQARWVWAGLLFALLGLGVVALARRR